MEITPQQYENVQRYLDGLMESDEKAAFLKEAGSNKALSEHLLFEERILENANHIAAARMEDIIKKAGKEWKEEELKKKNPRIFYITLAVAAAVISIIIISVLYSGQQQKKETSTTVANIDSNTNKKNNTGENPSNSSNDKILAALSNDEIYKKYYDEKAVSNEITSLGNVSFRGADENSKKIKNYLNALKELKKENYQQAIHKLTLAIGDSTNKPLTESSLWYISLASIKTDDTTTAIKSLNILSRSSSYKQSKEILADLQKKQ